MFADLLGFADFVDTSEPEFFFAALREHHDAMGAEIARAGGTIVDMTADAIGVVFNDLQEVENPEASAVHLALAMRSNFRELKKSWRERVVSAVGDLVSATDAGEVAFRNMRPLRAFLIEGPAQA